MPKKCQSKLNKTKCVLDENHEGDHRALQKQWNDKGEEVPVTIELTTTRALSMEVAKPLNMPWKDFDIIVNTLRSAVVPRLLRAGMDAQITLSVVGKAPLQEAIKRDGSAVIYQAIKAELETMKAKWKNKETLPALNICGGMVSAIDRHTRKSFTKRPSFGGKQPIPIRRQELKLSQEGDGVRASVKLLGAGRIELALRASKGTHWDTAKKLGRGELQYGAAKLVRSDRKKKWFLIVSYEVPIKPAENTSPDTALVIHRGRRKALTMLGSDGSYKVISGEKINRQLRKLEIRNRSTRRISAEELGSGAKGHGKDRRYKHYNALQNKRKRVVKTWCQQMGAAVVKQALKARASRVVIENYGGLAPNEKDRFLGRFPFYQLKSAIQLACEKHEIVVEEVVSSYLHTTCPVCGADNERAHNNRTGTFHCHACGFERPGDFVAALNMLKRSDVPSKVWDERHKNFLKFQKGLKGESPEEKPNGKSKEKSTSANGKSASTWLEP